MITVIGTNKDGNYFQFYFRDAKGFKHRIACYEDTAYGVKDFYMCAGIPNMTKEEFNALPDKI